MSTIKKNVMYSFLRQIVIIITPLILSPYLARVLGAEGIGVYSYSFTIVQYFGMFILLGLTNYGNRTISKVKDDRNQLYRTFWSIYSMQLIIGVFVFALYMVYISMFAEYKLFATIQIAYVIAMCLDVSWFLHGMEIFKVIALRSIVVKIITCISCLTFIKSADDLYIYVMIMTMSYLFLSLVTWPSVFKEIKFVKVTKAEIISHIKPNLILFVPVLAISIYSSMDIIMLGTFVEKSEVGYYTNTNSIMRLPLAFISAFGTVMLPRVSNMLSNGKEKETEQYLIKSLLMIIISTSAICFGIMSIVDIFLPWYFGPGFERCVTLAYYMLPCQFFLAIANVIRTQYIIPYGQDGIYIKSVFIGAIINFSINLMLMKEYGAVGAAIATLIAEGGVCIYQFYVVNKKVKLYDSLKLGIPFIVLGVIMVSVNCFVVAGFENPIVDIIARIVVGGTIYLLGAFVYYKISLRRWLEENK